jgi:hypothetical protein
MRRKATVEFEVSDKVDGGCGACNYVDLDNAVCTLFMDDFGINPSLISKAHPDGEWYYIRCKQCLNESESTE